MSFYLKDPASRIDYAMDWAREAAAGQSIVASTWTVAPAEAGGLEIEDDSFGQLRSKVRISGGIAGHVYALTNRVTLSDTKIDERSLTLRVEER